MVYDEKLADRIRKLLPDDERVSERKMFGGICFMLDGNMVCGVVRDDFMARVGTEGYDDALGQPHARPMDFTGRPMKGMLYVEPAGIAGKGLAKWVARCRANAESLPPKR